jgi:hypothetical protein
MFTGEALVSRLVGQNALLQYPFDAVQTRFAVPVLVAGWHIRSLADAWIDE